MVKKLVTNSLKILVAGGLIYWLVQSGKLELSFIEQVFSESPLRVFGAFAFILIDQIFVAIRLKIIMQTKAQEILSTVKLVIINWIGLFFNSVLPGAVTGDLVKIFYINDLDKSLDKKFALLGVLMDRIIGLIGLICIGGTFSLLNYSMLTGLSQEVTHLVHINLSLVAGIAFSAILFFFFSDLPLKISAKLKPFPVFNKVMPALENIWNTFLLFRSKLGILFFYSLIIQFLAVVIFWFLVHPFAEGADLSFSQTAAIMPIGFISMALPIAPAGLGVGHAVFGSLLGFYGITNGANLFNLYFIVVMMTNLSGAIPYVLYSSKKKLDLNEIQEN